MYIVHLFCYSTVGKKKPFHQLISIIQQKEMTMVSVRTSYFCETKNKLIIKFH